MFKKMYVFIALTAFMLLSNCAFCGANGEDIGGGSDEVLVMKKDTPAAVTFAAAVVSPEALSATAAAAVTKAVKPAVTAAAVKKATAVIKALKTPAAVKKATVEVSPEQQKINSLIAQIKAKQAARKAMLCDIVIKTSYTGGGASEQESRATVAIKKKDRFIVHFTSPMEQVMVSDGKWIWIYNVEAKQVLKQAAKDAAFDMNFYIEIEDSIEYFVNNSNTKMEETDLAYKLVMVPKNRKNLDFDEINVKIEKTGLVLENISMKAEGTVQEVVFSNVRNYTAEQAAAVAELADKNFKFTAPEGVEEIDTSGLINAAQ
jgi:chaperone LolA